MTAVPGRIAQLIAPLRDDPGHSAVLCDIDGTLAPIVADPLEAAVPAAAREALRAMARRYALVACVSGRRAAEARWLVGLDELTYVGNHGLEVLVPGQRQPTIERSAAAEGSAARSFVGKLDALDLAAAGLRLEDKGPIQSLHWRGASDETGAERRAREIAAAAGEAGLEPRWGRKVLEIRPIAELDKGTAVRSLLAGGKVELALYAGDDRTDLDAFRALRELIRDGDLRAAACIGIGSDEGPRELAAEADATVVSPDEFLTVLRTLAEPRARAAAHRG